MIKKEKKLLQQLLPHLVAVLCFLAVTTLYFSPIIEGKVISQHDIAQFNGASQELRDYYNNEGESSVWTGSMFSGMPAYQIGIWGESPNILNYLEMPLKALGNNTAGPVFAGMLMAYLMFIVLGFRPVEAGLGAIAYSLSSYNIIIIEAGHITKAWALAYMPLVVASMGALFRRKMLLAGLLMALGLALQIKNNHLQMTYYTGILCAVLYLGYITKEVFEGNKKPFLMAMGALLVLFVFDIIGVKSGFLGVEWFFYSIGLYAVAVFVAYMLKGVKERDYTPLKGVAALVVGVVIALMCNANSFYSNYELGQESIRGKSELTTPTESGKQSSGLDKDYAFQWSYGKGETFTLLVPNLYGGSTKPYDTGSESVKVLSGFVQSGQAPKEAVDQVRNMIPKYWGDQPMTSGPVYFGAITCFLFVLGMVVIRSKMKWALLAATLLFVLLSWGKNLEWFNDAFFYHFPLYNKFRAVSSALVVPALTMVIVAVWGIREFFDRLGGDAVSTSDSKGKVLSKKDAEGKNSGDLKNALYISAGVVGGICLLLAIAPSIFTNFVTETDGMWKDQLPQVYYDALLSDRKGMLTADAWRSLLFVVLSAGVLFVSMRMKGNVKKTSLVATLVIALLVLIDMWGVDKRFLNDDNFVAKSTLKSNTLSPRKANEEILKDKDLSYRVLNLNNPFNESHTSYFHKSIGGYHAAKQRRYQELIENRLVKEIGPIQQTLGTMDIDSTKLADELQNSPSLNMLNMRYIIRHPELPPVQNPYAYGNAWFVREYAVVNNADEEMAALATLKPLEKAVLDKRFAKEVDGLTIVPDSAATIVMTAYKPNMVAYKSKAAGDQLAVFSEVYYAHGWQAYIDGKEVPHFRTDWLLRGMKVPAGEHEIVFKFEPKEYNSMATFATVSSGLLVVLLIVFVVFGLLGKKKEE